ncbi:MAG: NAD-glutamate dehydrogenase, partial [Alsobacter sp.]
MSIQHREGQAIPSEAQVPPPGFERSLFGRVSPADLDQYPPAEVSAFAAVAWAHLREKHEAGRDSIRLVDRDVMCNGRPRDLTILQVVNDNMPFLLDSTLAELTERGMDIRFVAHPILSVERAGDGSLVRFAGEAAASGQPGTRRESLIQVHLDRVDDPVVREALVEALERVYADVRVAVRDWGAMRGRVAGLGYVYRSNPPPLPAEEIAEAVAFIDWLAADNFTLLGVREYRYAHDVAGEDAVDGTGLGILADPDVKVLRRGRELVTTTPEIRSFLTEPVPL